MDGKAKPDSDEILYLDEVHDEVTRPLTSTLTSSLNAIPSVHPRAGFFSGSETDGDRTPRSRRSSFVGTEADDLEGKLNPTAPFDIEGRNGPELPPGWAAGGVIASPAPPLQIVTPDVNVYQHKKTLAQGMMDLALLSANANQMRYVLQTDGRHPYFYPSLTMIAMSLFLQIAVGIGLIWNSVYNVKEHEQMCKANKANNWTVIGIFLVTILNVFISSFGVVDQTTAVTT